MKIGFNNEKYVKLQSEKIKERIKMFDKLYLEIGGKLFSDNHAERVLPGFIHDSKIKMFQELKNISEIIFCINANDIEKNKIRAEYGITYDIEILNIINNGEKWVLRLKSMGNFNKKIIFKDLVKGTIELPENDIDQVLVKSDGIPPYAFAHVCDDHFMRVTTVTRDDSYISSVPYHLELWDACGFKAPKFAHLLPLNKKEDNTIRKISKRKDPEAAVSFYHEKGIPIEAIKLYFATIMNSNFEAWFLQNPDKSFREFKFAFNKMSKSGPIFDLDKLTNLSKEYISRLKADELYDKLLTWALEFDTEFADLIKEYKEYTINVLNIER